MPIDVHASCLHLNWDEVNMDIFITMVVAVISSLSDDSHFGQISSYQVLLCEQL